LYGFEKDGTLKKFEKDGALNSHPDNLEMEAKNTPETLQACT